MAAHSDDVFHHVRDSQVFELPQFLGGEWPLPKLGDWQLTKFMALQVVAAVLTLIVFRGLAKRIANGEPAEGPWWNFWETLALFVRDLVRDTLGEGHHAEHGHGDDDGHKLGHGHAHATFGGHPADKYVPYVWSCFFYVLICNLLGAFPWLGSATGHLWVTGVLAGYALLFTVYYGSRELGFVGFLKNLAPPIDVPLPLKIMLMPMIWGIEFLGLLSKHGVLAIRLFANMMAGHTVVAVMLGFINDVGDSPLFYLVAPASILGQVAMGMLELFVAFLQAFIFSFLATLFIGAASHPH